MTTTRAGRLRTPITIQKDTGTARGSAGSPTPSWATHVKRMARVVPLDGREPHESGQKFSETRSRFEMRHVPQTDEFGKTATTPKMRILWGTRIFDIVSVVGVEERRRMTHIIATEATT